MKSRGFMFTLSVAALAASVVTTGCRRSGGDNSDLPPVTADEKKSSTDKKKKRRKKSDNPPTTFDYEKDSLREITEENASAALDEIEAALVEEQREIAELETSRKDAAKAKADDKAEGDDKNATKP